MAVNPLSLPSTSLSSQSDIYSPVYRLECDSEDNLATGDRERLNDDSENFNKNISCNEPIHHLEVQVIIEEDPSDVSPE